MSKWAEKDNDFWAGAGLCLVVLTFLVAGCTAILNGIDSGEKKYEAKMAVCKTIEEPAERILCVHR